MTPSTRIPASQASAGHHAAAGIQLGVHWTHVTPWGVINLDTVLYSAIVMVLCLLFFGLLGQSVALRPRSDRIIRTSTLEWIVEFVQKLLDDQVGRGSGKFLWYIGSLFIFILTANWLNLLPWRAWELAGGGERLAHLFHVHHALVYEAPTADLNTTAALALISLAMYWVAGIGRHNLFGFLGHHWFARPVLLFPLRMIEDLTRPMSLALRLFANILAGHAVGVILLGMILLGAAALIPLELIVGAVQAFIFAALSASYIGAAVAVHHAEH